MSQSNSVFSGSHLLLLAVCLLPLGATAGGEDSVPLQVLVSSAAMPAAGGPTVLNEDGVVEANIARVRDGVVYLEFDGSAAAYSAASR